MRKPADVDFIDQPLYDALDSLGFENELQFHIKAHAMEDQGVSVDSPVNLSLKNVPLELALDLILEQLSVTYVIRDGVILITTVEELEQNFADVRVYNCRDLLAMATYGMPNADIEPDDEEEFGDDSLNETSESTKGDSYGFPRNVLAQIGGGGAVVGGLPQPQRHEDDLMAIITTAVMPDSWEEVGGTGTIAEFDGLIVVRHNPRIHRQVEQVLQMLREASSEQPWTGSDAVGGGGGGGFF